MIAALRAKFPAIVSSKSDDICYATTNRQIAVKQLARECDLVLVIGSTNSSNSNRLVEVAREHGAASHLIDNHTQVQEEWLEGVETVGITSGASAPEELVESLVELFRERGAERRLRAAHRPRGRALHAPQGDPRRARRPRLRMAAIRRMSAAAKLTDQIRRPGEGRSVSAVGLVAVVLGQCVEARVRRSATESSAVAVELDAELALALDRRVGAAGLVVDRQLLAVLARRPGLLPGAAGEQLGGRGHHLGARARRVGRSGSIGSGSSRRASSSRSSSWIAILGRQVFALAEVEPGSGRRPVSRGRGWASPRSRRSARGRARRRSRPGTRRRASASPAATLAGSAPNGKRGACTPIVLRPGVAVAPRPTRPRRAACARC